MRELLLLCKIIQNSYFKKKISLEEQKVQKEDWFPRERQIDRFHDLRLHSGYWRSWYSVDYADSFSVTLRDDNEFDTEWDEVLPSMSEIAPDDVLESVCK